MTKSVMNLVLSLTQYCFSISTKSVNDQTLNQVQGDKLVLATLPPGRELR
jgi:hypothetical protein